MPLAFFFTLVFALCGISPPPISRRKQGPSTTPGHMVLFSVLGKKDSHRLQLPNEAERTWFGKHAVFRAKSVCVIVERVFRMEHGTEKWHALAKCSDANLTDPKLSHQTRCEIFLTYWEKFAYRNKLPTNTGSSDAEFFLFHLSEGEKGKETGYI